MRICNLLTALLLVCLVQGVAYAQAKQTPKAPTEKKTTPVLETKEPPAFVAPAPTPTGCPGGICPGNGRVVIRERFVSIFRFRR